MDDTPDLTRSSRGAGRAVIMVVALLFMLAYTFRHKLIGHDFGESCSNGNDCRSGLCAVVGGVATTCTQECARDADCPTGNRCTNDKAKNFCIRRGTLAFGAACEDSNDCASGVCLTADDDGDPPGLAAPHKKSRGRCGQPCGAGGACPKGSSCNQLGGEQLCFPDDVE